MRRSLRAAIGGIPAPGAVVVDARVPTRAALAFFADRKEAEVIAVVGFGFLGVTQVTRFCKHGK